MLFNGGSSLVLWPLLILLPLLRSKADAELPLAAVDSAGHFVVKLHRQQMPVKGESEAVSYKNVYFGTVYIGSPAKQEFSVIFDTGSGHVVVPSTRCKSATCRIHRRYDRRASSLAVDVDLDGTPVKPGSPRDQITVAYGTGEITGHFVSDRLCLSDNGTKAADSSAPAGEQQDCLTFRVVTATAMTHDPFHSFSFDGVLGLGLDALTLAPEFSFFGQMAAQGKIAEPYTFGVFLAEGEDEQSEICFGGYVPERLQSHLVWAPVARPELGYWQVQIKSIRIGNRSLDYCNDGQCHAVVDTGSSLLAVPHDFADELEDALTSSLRDPPSHLGRGIDCKHAEGDVLHFDIEGLTVSLTAGDYARPAVVLHDGDDDVGNSSTGDTNGAMEAPDDIDSRLAAEGKCKTTIKPMEMSAPIGPKLFIWGEPVLRRYYSVYDVAEKRIGFGLAAHSTSDVALRPSTSSTRRPLLAV